MKIIDDKWWWHLYSILAWPGALATTRPEVGSRESSPEGELLHTPPLEGGQG